MTLLEQLTAYVPCCEQEEKDHQILLSWLRSGQDVFTRKNPAAHFTASAWVVSPDRQQVLLIYHNIYRSWSWMGGHADGETDLLAVAQREVQEECGLRQVRVVSPEIFSLEILTVDGHIKRGQYVPSHLHLNVTYLFEAAPSAAIAIKPDENSGVGWFALSELGQAVSEPWMLERVYSKLCRKVSELSSL